MNIETVVKYNVVIINQIMILSTFAYIMCVCTQKKSIIIEKREERDTKKKPFKLLSRK